MNDVTINCWCPIPVYRSSETIAWHCMIMIVVFWWWCHQQLIVKHFLQSFSVLQSIVTQLSSEGAYDCHRTGKSSHLASNDLWRIVVLTQDSYLICTLIVLCSVKVICFIRSKSSAQWKWKIKIWSKLPFQKSVHNPMSSTNHFVKTALKRSLVKWYHVKHRINHLRQPIICFCSVFWCQRESDSLVLYRL